MVKYAEIRINREAFVYDTLLRIRLRQFLEANRGWSKQEDFNTLETIIQFISPETFKQFLIEFAESDKEQAMTKHEAQEYLKEKGILVSIGGQVK